MVCFKDFICDSYAANDGDWLLFLRFFENQKKKDTYMLVQANDVSSAYKERLKGMRMRLYRTEKDYPTGYTREFKKDGFNVRDVCFVDNKEKLLETLESYKRGWGEDLEEEIPLKDKTAEQFGEILNNL
jgi:hypothetical protein